jgi:hypothetical protein
MDGFLSLITTILITNFASDITTDVNFKEFTL